MRRHADESLRALPRLLAAALSISAAGTLAADEAAWSALEESRRGLAEERHEATFEQTFIPAGFTSGDRERGHLYLAIPDCLRWDYEDPYPRSYLLCGRTVWAWSGDEPVGDRYLSVSRDEAGLDFLLLSVERLRERYEASIELLASGDRRILLESKAADAAFARAEIVIGASDGRPLRLAYSDEAGDRTSFELTGFGPLEATDRFLPPEDIEWIDG